MFFFYLFFGAFSQLVGLFFGNSSQTSVPKGLQFEIFNKSHCGVVIRKFGEYLSKTLPMELI